MFGRFVSTIKGATALWLPGALGLVVLLMSVFGAFEGLDRLVSDALLRARLDTFPWPLSPRVFPVDLNDRAERNLGTAVESRRAFADLFQVLGDGHLVGGMDFLFQDPKDPSGDAAFIQAAAQMDGLVLAVVPVDRAITQFSGQELTDQEKQLLESKLWHPQVRHAGAIPRAETFLMPFPALAQATRYFGHIGVRPDGDGLYRKSPMFFRWGDGYVPCLALALVAASLHLDPGKIVVDAGREVVLPTPAGPIRVPIDREGNAWIPYPARWDHSGTRTPLDKVVRARADADQEDDLLTLWDGGIVVGADLTTSHKDFGPTPIESIYPLSGIHTSLINGMLTGRMLADTPGWYRWGEGLFVLIVAVGSGLLRSSRAVQFVHLGALGALAVGAGALWLGADWVPWLVGPVAALGAGWAGTNGLRLVRAHQERQLMESALSRYFPRSLAARVLDEKKVDLVPANKDLSLLFADIAGFTRWSSDKPADLVHDFLSDYLESMAQILFSHGGTIDKFMGDGILAFFGDPFDQPDHAARCARAALAMRAQVRVLQERWGVRAGLELKIRIGINSGTVIVGNLGSQTRIEYTVIGSAVNLAQRMEGNAPVGGILVTEETRSRLGDQFSFGERRWIDAKGYEEKVAAFVLEGASAAPSD